MAQNAPSDFRSYPAWRWTLEPGDDLVDDFLLPALVRAKRYDRQAGFFSSSSLVVSAKGVEHLLGAVARSEWPAYRLIVCEKLDPADVDAIASGERVRRLEERLTERMLWALEAPSEAAARDRLALLAAMVAVGFAEIRVVVPAGLDGRPRPGAIEHAKVAIVWDRAGHTLVAFGSANESWQGWVHNNEQMDLYASWEEPAWSRYGQSKVERFERLWEGRDPSALTVDLPRAVRERLVALAPDEVPRELVQPPEARARLLTPEQEAVVLQFLRDAPRLPGGNALAMTTAAVRPWPHHVGIVQTALAQDAPRFLLCDEVGLGKTIEAAFILRQMQMEGRAQRVLILAPHSLREQWQDELIGKFSLVSMLYNGSELVGPDLGDGRAREKAPVDRREVFAQFQGVLIAGSEMMRRQDRRDDLLRAPPWDLVVVDEAHHARRTGFDQHHRTPNQLLSLLQALAPRARAMLVLTATPMQIHPMEVWDLLKLLGIDGPLGSAYPRFEHFYRAVAVVRGGPLDRPVLDGLFETVRAGAAGDPSLLALAERQNPLLYRRWKTAIDTPVAREGLVRLPLEERGVLWELFVSHAPTRQRLFRTTRRRLREYSQQGLLRDPVPKREVPVERIALTAAEQAVYTAVEEYLARHYRDAKTGGQRGLGFVLTCYRQRLASSPYALRRSLERLRERLTAGKVHVGELLDADDLADVPEVGDEEVEPGESLLLRPAALAELDSLLADVARLGQDSKLERLHAVLDSLGREYERVIIFTQYTDTMDYVRRALLQRTSRIGSYSGRGGEAYDPASNAFVTIPKEELQARFRQDGGVSVLVCTNAAAEGLNLQVCGAMVNYDMPWNPMRLEQRIGRIDRIGQAHRVVRIHNLVATPSVEDDVYDALEKRIGLFEEFVGPLQPILSTVERTIRELAMMAPEQRAAVQPGKLDELQARISELEQQAPTLPVAEGFERPVFLAPVPSSPVLVDDLREVWLRSPTLLRRAALRTLSGCVYEIRWAGRLYRITFDPEVAQRRVGDALLFTYGHPVFEALTASRELDPDSMSAMGIDRRVDSKGTVSYWNDARRIETLHALLAHLGVTANDLSSMARSR